MYINTYQIPVIGQTTKRWYNIVIFLSAVVWVLQQHQYWIFLYLLGFLTVFVVIVLDACNVFILFVSTSCCTYLSEFQEPSSNCRFQCFKRLLVLTLLFCLQNFKTHQVISMPPMNDHLQMTACAKCKNSHLRCDRSSLCSLCVINDTLCSGFSSRQLGRVPNEQWR